MYLLSVVLNGKNLRVSPLIQNIYCFQKAFNIYSIAMSRNRRSNGREIDSYGREILPMREFNPGGFQAFDSVLRESIYKYEGNLPTTELYARRNQLEGSGGPLRVTCGELRMRHAGRTVELVGRVQKQKLGKFILLRDGHGYTQLVIPSNRPDLAKRFEHLPNQSFISIIGCVIPRPSVAFNMIMPTGDVEVSISEVVMVQVHRPFGNSPRTMPAFTSTRNMSSSSYHPKQLTSEEYSKCGNSQVLIRKMQERVDTCGDLTNADGGRAVTLLGWMQQHHLCFLKLRDGYGIIQCLLPTSKPELSNIVSNIGSDSILEVHGVVMCRPDSQVNTSTSGGDIEILVSNISVLDPNELEVSEIEESTKMETACESEKGVNSFALRTHTCGELRVSDGGEHVTLCGWLQHRRMKRFLTLRDSYGAIQCVLPEKEINRLPKLDDIPLESIVEVSGVVGVRRIETVNPTMETGEVEVVVETLRVSNPATITPIVVRYFQKPKELLRLQHRYVYLRYPDMQNNLRTRSTMLMDMRKFLIDDHKFVEVETPTLFCRTPGGAKEFIVPTRHTGEFFSLVQSPQQFKQMLMAGAIDRYFQVARCYRDESIRGDRQPEFTQLDLELSFAGREEILTLMEALLRASWPRPLPPGPFPRLTYSDAINTYGSDKPDISYDLKLQNITSTLSTNQNLINKSPTDFNGCAIVVKNMLTATNSFKKSLQDFAKNKHSRVSFICSELKKEESLEDWYKTPLSNLLGDEVMKSIVAKLDLVPGDFIVLAYGPKEQSCMCLGDIRLKLAKQLGINQEKYCNIDRPIWIVDFPLFIKGDSGQLETCHHPFTAPHPADEHLLHTDPLKVRSLAYDLVIGGNEVGGGSVRAHSGTLQRELLKMLNIPTEPLKHLLNALDSGCPPHAGIALGIDRLVTIACQAESIRDVIAFPKSHEGKDPLSGAPSALTEEEQQHYHIKVSP